MKDGEPKSKQEKEKRKQKDTAKKTAVAEDVTHTPILDAETRRAQLRVAKARDKLRAALDDPEKRKQMVEAIRTMMRGEE